MAILLLMSSRSSGRPRLTRKGAVTRARIVDAAAELIFQQGVAGTTIEEVRDGAHVSSSQLYHYFEDKPALVRAVIERQADRAIGTQERFDLSSLEGLREWRDFVVDHNRDTGGRGGCPVGSLGAALAETEPEARVVLAASFKRWEASIMAGLLRMHALGRLAPEADPRQLALALLAALEGGLCSLRSSATPNRSRPRSTRCSRSSPPSAAPRALRSTADPWDRRSTGSPPGARAVKCAHIGLHEPVMLESPSLEWIVCSNF